MSTFTLPSRETARADIRESRGSLMAITSTVDTRESAVQYQASSTSDRLPRLNKQTIGTCLKSGSIVLEKSITPDVRSTD